jgi:hypothetical protein
MVGEVRGYELIFPLSEDVGDPMLAQHLYTLMMFQRLAIANGHGWNRFLHTVDQVLPRRGDTIPLPHEMPPTSEDDEAANGGGLVLGEID